MCIIAYVPAGTDVTKEIVETMFEGNPDGAGLMMEGGYIEKGFFNAADLWDAYDKLPKNKNRAIHCRIATSGAIGKANCHPFLFHYGTAMHNGVLHGYTPKGGLQAKKSDTALFTEKVLCKLSLKMYHNKGVQQLLNDSLAGSRLLLFLTDGSVMMFGDWIEDNGVYYSNGSYKQMRWHHSDYDKWWQDYEDSNERESKELLLGIKRFAPRLYAELQELAEHHWGLHGNLETFATEVVESDWACDILEAYQTGYNSLAEFYGDNAIWYSEENKEDK